ncbi:uncharacterized protein [Haliotis cracherodii]|uniref:uncharacterized protein n=1 Tax=Haliotis cracherodii TaxID=6455 RepID=UPI0039EA7283
MSSMESLSLTCKIIAVTCFVGMTTCSFQFNTKNFQLYRLWDMDDLMPPFRPVSPITCKEECAMICMSDVTCAAFSHGEYVRFCMVTPESVRPYDVSISSRLSGFTHYSLYEDIGEGILPPGYRTFNISKLALRFHYYWPKNWTDARDTCASESGRLLTLDTEEKRQLLQDLITSNKELSTTGTGLYVGGTVNGTEFYWEDGTLLANSDPLWAASPAGTGNCTILDRDKGFRLVDGDCSLEQPYICEHLHFETQSTLPSVGRQSLT